MLRSTYNRFVAGLSIQGLYMRRVIEKIICPNIFPCVHWYCFTGFWTTGSVNQLWLSLRQLLCSLQAARKQLSVWMRPESPFLWWLHPHVTSSSSPSSSHHDGREWERRWRRRRSISKEDPGKLQSVHYLSSLYGSLQRLENGNKSNIIPVGPDPGRARLLQLHSLLHTLHVAEAQQREGADSLISFGVPVESCYSAQHIYSGVILLHAK